MSDHYRQDVPARTGPHECVKCCKTLARHDRLTEVKIVAGIGPSPTAAGRALYVSEEEEYAHLDCRNRDFDSPVPTLHRRALTVTIDLAPLHARTDDFICVRCKKTFVRGDRIVPTLICEGIGVDESGNKGVQCAREYEMVHYDCHDPQLAGTP